MSDLIDSMVIGPTPGHLSPEGEVLGQLWYEELKSPVEKTDIEKARELIAQVEIPDWKRTCHLTSQLNMWILSGQMTTQEAIEIQSELVFGAKFEGCWAKASLGRGFGWNAGPHYTSYYVNKIIGKKVSFGFVSVNEAEQLGRLLRHLDSGYRVTLADEFHSRVAFLPEGLDKYYVFDPLHKMLRGLYTSEQVVRLQNRSSAFYIS